MLRKINNYHLFILILIVFILNTILFRSIDITKAQWQPPSGAPGESTANIVTSPLSANLDLGGQSIIGNGGININGGIICDDNGCIGDSFVTSNLNSYNLKRDIPANLFAYGLNMTSVPGATEGTHTVDGKFQFACTDNSWAGGYISSIGYTRVADRVLEFTVDTANSGSATAQPDHIMLGWGENSLAPENYRHLPHAIYLDKPVAGGYNIYVYEDGNHRGHILSATWGDVIVFRIVLKTTGADYYYKQNNGTWNLGYSGTYSTESLLYPSIAPHSGRYLIHSMHIYDEDRSLVFNNGTIYAKANNQKYFQGGDDAGLYDINVANTVGIYGVQDSTKGNIKLGSSGPMLSGESGKLTIGGDATANAFYYSSDKQLKKDIRKINNPLDKIMQLEGISFKWQEDNEESLGLIAQDVEKVFPELVSTNNEGLKTVAYGNLIAPLIEALKVQENEIKQLSAQIKELRNNYFSVFSF